MIKTTRRTQCILLSLLIITALASCLYYATLAGMYKGAGKLLSVKWVAQWKLNYPSNESNNDCSATWSPAVNGKVPYMVPFYPEVEAAYWMLPMSTDPEVFDNPVAYQLKGQFPYARYMSFHTYDATTGDFVTSLKDVDISPDKGSINPYQKAVKRDRGNRDYTLWVIPEGANLPQLSHAKNIMVIPKSVTSAPSVLRVYRPDNGRGMNGGVPLPTVTAFDANTGQAVNKCAPLHLITPKSIEEGEDARRFDRSITISPNIRHYRSNGAGFYPNKHNAYLVTELDRDLGELAAIKFKAPTTPLTQSGKGMFHHSEQVRYWSYCLGGELASNTSFCLVDDQALIDENGYVSIILGPDDNNLKMKAQQASINYISWGIHYRPTTILRHMDGEKPFENHIQNVPELNINLPLEAQAGEHFIGHYSPTGYYCSQQDFEKDFCGIKIMHTQLSSTQQ